MADSPLDQFGEFGTLAPLLVTLDRLRAAAVDIDLVWVLPADVLAGVSQAFGLPVVRAAVEWPMLAHVLAEPDREVEGG